MSRRPRVGRPWVWSKFPQLVGGGGVFFNNAIYVAYKLAKGDYRGLITGAGGRAAGNASLGAPQLCLAVTRMLLIMHQD